MLGGPNACVTDGQNMCDQITRGRRWKRKLCFCAFHSFLVEVQTIAGYIHVTHAK